MQDGDDNPRACELIIKGTDCKGVLIFSNITILFIENVDPRLSSF